MAGSNLLAGFVKGASDFGVRSIEEGRKNQRDLEKVRLLEQLRMETEKEMTLFRDALEAKRADKDLTSVDFNAGKKILRNRDGKEIGQVDLTSSDMEAYQQERSGKALDQDYKRALISSTAADDRRADERLALDRQKHADDLVTSRMARKNYSDTQNNDEALNGDFNRVFQLMQKTGANEAELADAEAKWFEGTRSKKWTKEQQKVYIATLAQKYADRTAALAASGLLPSQIIQKKE